jgi:hypothetical protein
MVVVVRDWASAGRSWRLRLCVGLRIWGENVTLAACGEIKVGAWIV